MGALHEGHLALIHEAHRHGEAVAASIFVNPLQFNDKNDLERYPRQPEQDCRLLEAAGCNMVLLPDAEELFHGHNPTTYALHGLDTILEGASRPGHFQGVVNVVERLFHYVRPDVALFGEKDRQQLAVLRFAAKANRWPVQLLGHPVVRAADGLALSSRNMRLSATDRGLAPLLHQALMAVQAAAFHRPVEDARRAGLSVLQGVNGIALDYLAICHAETLLPLTTWEGAATAAALIAAQVGPVRLIDNLTLVR